MAAGCLHQGGSAAAWYDSITTTRRTPMDGLHAPQPKLIDVAMPANRSPGLPHGV